MPAKLQVTQSPLRYIVFYSLGYMQQPCILKKKQQQKKPKYTDNKLSFDSFIVCNILDFIYIYTMYANTIQVSTDNSKYLYYQYYSNIKPICLHATKKPSHGCMGSEARQLVLASFSPLVLYLSGIVFFIGWKWFWF